MDRGMSNISTSSAVFVLMCEDNVEAWINVAGSLLGESLVSHVQH